MIPELHRRLPEPCFRRGLQAWARAAPPRCLRKYGTPSPSDVVCDVGAMFGEFAIPAATHADHVYALDPGPDAFARLEQSSWHIPNLDAHPVAAWHEHTTLEFDIPNDPSEAAASVIGSDTPTTRQQHVDAKPLRAFDWFDSVTFLKIDAEGCEPEVLAGIGDYRPGTIVVDASPERHGQPTTEAVWSWLIGAGYSANRDGDILTGRHTAVSTAGRP